MSPPKNYLKVKCNKSSLEKLILEVKYAESNFTTILEAARDLSKASLLSQFSGGFKTEQLEAMIQDLRLMLSLIRRDIKNARPNDPVVDFGTLPIATKDQVVPVRIAANQYKCLCPMTVFLKLIAEKLTSLRIKVRGNDWGPIRPLRDVIARMETRLRFITVDAERKIFFCPGLAQCIILHEEHSTFTVASTAPRYNNLSGLDRLGRDIRYDHLAELKKECSPAVIQRIADMEKLSEDVVSHYHVKDALRDDEWHRWQNPFEVDGNRARVNGFGGSFEPNGTYKLACLLDYWRFTMDRPQAAELIALELNSKTDDRGVSAKASCAEWELWIAKLSSPPVHPPPSLRPVPKREGMPKSGTWEKSERPQVLLPAVPLPTARRSGPPRPEMSTVNQRPPPIASFPEGPGRAGNGTRPARRPLDVPPRPVNRRNEVPSAETQAFYNYAAAQNTSQRPARPQMGPRYESHSSGSTNPLVNQNHPATTPKPERGCCIVQ